MKRLEVWSKRRRLDVLRGELEDARRQVAGANRENLELRARLDRQAAQLADVKYTVLEAERLAADFRARIDRLRGVVGW